MLKAAGVTIGPIDTPAYVAATKPIYDNVPPDHRRRPGGRGAEASLGLTPDRAGAWSCCPTTAPGSLPGGLAAGGPRLTSVRAALLRADRRRSSAGHRPCRRGPAGRAADHPVRRDPAGVLQPLLPVVRRGRQADPVHHRLHRRCGGLPLAPPHLDPAAARSAASPAAASFCSRCWNGRWWSPPSIALFQGLLLLQSNWDNLTPILQISTGWISLPLPIGMGLLALFALERLLLQHRPAAALARSPCGRVHRGSDGHRRHQLLRRRIDTLR